MRIDPAKLDAYHERIGIKASRHPFTAGGGRDGKPTAGCVICPYSEGHVTHSGAEVIAINFRDRRRA